MRVLILGVGDAFTERSFGTSAVVQGPRGYVLIDCPDLVHRAVHEAAAKAHWGVDVNRIDDLILTHLHGDHSNGLESFGFARLVQRLRGEKGKLPRIHTHHNAAARLWEKLAPAMDAPLTKGGRKSTLEDYFEVHLIEPGTTADVAGLSVECRYTRHPIPTIGLRVSDGGKTLGWSGDTVYDPEHIAWLSSADVIVHEANLGPAHTHIEMLNTLPPEVRAKVRITHVADDFDPGSTDMRVLSEGEVLEF